MYVIALLAVPLCIADIRESKIPNIYLFYMCAISIPYLAVFGLGDLSKLGAFLIVLVVLYLLGMGMGDVKLLAILGALLISMGHGNLLVLAVMIVSLATLHILCISLARRSIPNAIALAPSIWAGLLLYLATS
jgi:Flp pilus assembly protein protease CpaA